MTSDSEPYRKKVGDCTACGGEATVEDGRCCVTMCDAGECIPCPLCGAPCDGSHGCYISCRHENADGTGRHWWGPLVDTPHETIYGRRAYVA